MRAASSLVKWGQIRHALGASQDRRLWLQFFCSVTDYRPFPWQTRFHLASARPGVRANKLVTAGIRTGKTHSAIAEESMLITANPGVNHFVIAPTYDQVREVLIPEFIRYWDQMAEAGYPVLRRMKWSILRADLHCGGRVFFRSADKVDNLRGFEGATLHFDEGDYTRHPRDAYDVLTGRLSARTHVRQITVSTTSRDYAGSMCELWSNERMAADYVADPRARAELLREWFYMRARTYDNPTLPDDFMRGLLSYSKRKWLVEVEGCIAFLDQARVWPEYSARHRRPFRFNPRRPYHLGIDWGNRPAYLWIQPLGDGTSDVFRQWVEDGVPPVRQLEEVARICRDECGYPPARAAVDRADPEMITRFARVFPSCEIQRADSKDEQLRSWSVEAVRTMLDPLVGPPTLYFADQLAAHDAPARGVHAAVSAIEWERRGDGIYLPWARKDGILDHVTDALSYWAKLIGVNEAMTATVHWRGARQAPSLNELRNTLFGGAGPTGVKPPPGLGWED